MRSERTERFAVSYRLGQMTREDFDALADHYKTDELPRCSICGAAVGHWHGNTYVNSGGNAVVDGRWICRKCLQNRDIR